MGRIYARKVEYDGIRFDSEMECEYYKLLKERKDKGEIFNLEIHPRFELIPQYINNNGKEIKPIYYEADFSFYDSVAGRSRVIDVKGMMEDDFVLKWKMFDKKMVDLKFNIYLEVLKYSKSTGWVDYEDYKKARKTYKQQLIAKKNEAIKRAKEIEKERAREQKEIERYLILNSKEKRSKAEEERMQQLYTKHKSIIDKFQRKEASK